MMKGTRVDGIYTADPEKDPRPPSLTASPTDEAITVGLKVMDLTATALCMEK